MSQIAWGLEGELTVWGNEKLLCLNCGGCYTTM
jgi:hypothetical protein